MKNNLWEVPVKLSVSYETEPFPIDVFPKWCLKYIREVSQMVGSPSELAANMFLSLVAGMAAKKFKVACQSDYTVPLNLWTITLLGAGGGKSPVLKKILEPFDGTDIKDQIYDDVSLSRLPAFLQANNESGIIMSAEMTLLHNILTTTMDVSLLLSSFDGEQKRIERKNCSMILREPKTSIGLAFQPKVMEMAKNYKRFTLMKYNGFFDRFLFSMPDQTGFELGSKEPLGYETQAQYREKMHMLGRLWDSKDIFVFQMTEGQRDKITKFEQDQLAELQEDGKYASIEGFCRKASGKILRLAGIMHLLRLTECDGTALGNPDIKIAVQTISDEAVDSAIRLISYYRMQMLKVFGELDDSHLASAKKLLKRIRENRKCSFTRRDLQQQLRDTQGLKTMEELDAALFTLERYGYIRLHDNVQKRGKKSVLIEAYPGLFDSPFLRAV